MLVVVFSSFSSKSMAIWIFTHNQIYETIFRVESLTKWSESLVFVGFGCASFEQTCSNLSREIDEPEEITKHQI